MKTVQTLKQGIKELALTNSLDDISVISLCNYVGIKRQTFYYHYRDIYDLVQGMFIDDSYEFLNGESNKEKFVSKLFMYIKNDENFLRIIAKSNVSDVLRDFFYDIFYSFTFDKIADNSKKSIIIRSIALVASNELVILLSSQPSVSESKISDIVNFAFRIGELNG